MKKILTNLILLFLFLISFSNASAQHPLNMKIDKGTQQKTDTLGGVIARIGLTDGRPVSVVWSFPSGTVVDEYKYEQNNIYTKRQVDENSDGLVEFFVYGIESFAGDGRILQEINWFTDGEKDTTFSKAYSQKKTQVVINKNFLELFYEEDIIEEITSVSFFDFVSVKTYEYWDGGLYIRALTSEGIDSLYYKSSFTEMHFDFLARLKRDRTYEDNDDDTYFEKAISNFYILDSTSSQKLDTSVMSRKYDKKLKVDIFYTSKENVSPRRVYGRDLYVFIQNIHRKSREKIMAMKEKFF